MNNTTETTLRKEIRKSARLSLRKHYWIFVVAALVAAILGTEYANTTQIFRIQRRIRTEQTQPVQAELDPHAPRGVPEIVEKHHGHGENLPNVMPLFSRIFARLARIRSWARKNWL